MRTSSIAMWNRPVFGSEGSMSSLWIRPSRELSLLAASLNRSTTARDIWRTIDPEVVLFIVFIATGALVHAMAGAGDAPI